MVILDWLIGAVTLALVGAGTCLRVVRRFERGVGVASREAPPGNPGSWADGGRAVMVVGASR
jgi:hypothetical protein